jgi:hypothetical protein
VRVIALPEEDSRRAEALRLLSVWKITVEMNSELPDREELAMPLPQAFLEWEQQVRDQGRQEGIRTVALNLMRTGMSLYQVAEVTGLSLKKFKSYRIIKMAVTSNQRTITS